MDDERTLGRYRVTGTLGRGAMGVVYRGVDPRIGRSVAIKLIRNDAPDDLAEEARMRFELEFQAAGRLSHPHIVTIYDAGSEEDDLYFVMDLVDGGSLRRRVAAGTGLPSEEAVRIAKEVASALDYAHTQGFVHRDIKPANILMDADGRTKVADFGIAKFQGVDNTRTGGILGTPAYMSPEQADSREISGASDQFSLAVIVYEMLTGQRPFQGNRHSEILMAILRAAPTLPTELNGALPAAVNQVLLKALAKEPEQRFPTCMQFVQTLEACFGEELPATIVAMPEDTVPSSGVDPATAQPPAGPPVPGTAQPVAGTVQPVPGTVQPVAGTVQPLGGTPPPPPDTAQTAAQHLELDPDIKAAGTGPELRSARRDSQLPQWIVAAVVLVGATIVGAQYFLRPAPDPVQPQPQPQAGPNVGGADSTSTPPTDPPPDAGQTAQLDDPAGAARDQTTQDEAAQSEAEQAVDGSTAAAPAEGSPSDDDADDGAAGGEIAPPVVPEPPVSEPAGPIVLYSVTIRSEPAGAQVQFDGETVGTTPVDVELIEGQRHSVGISAEGYEPQGWAFTEADLNESQRQDRALDFPLVPSVAPGTLEIDSSYDVTVTAQLIRNQDGSRVTGRTTEISADAPAELTPGVYEVSLAAPEVFYREVRQVSVVSEESVRVNTPRLFRVNIRAVPANCRVTIGDRFVDSTPILRLSIAQGTYQIRFEWPGLDKMLTTTVTIDRDRQDIFARPPE